MNEVPINLAAEDMLSELVLRKLLKVSKHLYAVGPCYVRSGFGYLKKTIRGFNNAAKGTPFLVLTDLDRYECPPILIEEWLSVPRNPNLLFRVAVRQVEAWVMAHRSAFARFLGIREDSIPKNVDDLSNPKMYLLKLVGNSRNHELRLDIVPPPESDRTQGPNYNGRLGKFVIDFWDPRQASANSPSLKRTVDRLDAFSPTW